MMETAPVLGRDRPAVLPNKNASGGSAQDADALIAHARLAAQFRRLDFLSACSVEERLGIADHCTAFTLETASPHTVEDPETALTFLLTGSLRLEGEGGVNWLDGATPQARSPLPGGARLRDGGKAERAQLIVVPTEALQSQRRGPRLIPAPLEALVVERLFADFDAGTLRLPTMPTVAFRIRERAEDPNVNLQEVADIAQTDGAIAGRLLHVANSVAFANGPRVRSALAAVQRLGLRTTQHLVLSLALREVFAFKGRGVRQAATEGWRFSVAVSAAAHAVAGRAGLDSEKALMAGLVHQIGRVPVLGALERSGAQLSGETLEALLRVLTGPVSHLVHRYWDLDRSCLDAMTFWDQWDRQHDGAGDYGDVVQTAACHCLARRSRENDHPALDSLPAYRRLGFNPEERKSLEDEMNTSIGMMGPLLQG